MIEGTEELLTGWGNTAPSLATVVTPRSAEEVVEVMAGQGPMIARGLGRSYGDASQCAGGTVMSNRALWHLSPIDPSTGLVTAGAGVSIDKILNAALPAGQHCRAKFVRCISVYEVSPTIGLRSKSAG
jgi:decaprenylphospho-beta-D-ribofuranose 2-oxidase